jgi:uncharacterized protein YndB with AHSA1/START domain
MLFIEDLGEGRYMSEEQIKQTAVIKAPAQAVYDALMNSKQHAEFTRAAANIENKVDGEFSVWDGYATGKNLELDPGKKWEGMEQLAAGRVSPLRS